MKQNSVLLKYNISNEVDAFSTMRNGAGISEGVYGQMNINPYCGDNEQNVLTNKAILSELLEMPTNKIILPHQTHGTQCKIITADFFALNEKLRCDYLDNTDALITQMPQVCIGISTADCVPTLLYDNKQKTVAAIHAGWRGTANHIVRKTIELMQNLYSCNPLNLKAIIGPSISQNAFEVGQEVYDNFQLNNFDMPSIAKKIKDKWHIDLWEANRKEMIRKNVPSENIVVTSICTYSNYNNFFSARRLTIKSGRIYTGIIIK